MLGYLLISVIIVLNVHWSISLVDCMLVSPCSTMCENPFSKLRAPGAWREIEEPHDRCCYECHYQRRCFKRLPEIKWDRINRGPPRKSFEPKRFSNTCVPTGMEGHKPRLPYRCKRIERTWRTWRTWRTYRGKQKRRPLRAV